MIEYRYNTYIAQEVTQKGKQTLIGASIVNAVHQLWYTFFYG